MTERSCGAFQELASAFLDDQLEARELLALKHHLDRCEPCRRFLEELNGMRDLLRLASARWPAPVSPGFHTAVLQGIREQGGRRDAGDAGRFSRGFAWGRVAAIAAAALLFIGGLSFYRATTDEGISPVATREAADEGGEEGSVDAYLQQHTVLAIDSTLLGPPEGVEFASFDVVGR